MLRGGRCSTAKSGEGVRVTQSEKQWMKRLVYFLTAWRSMVKAELRWRGDGNGGAGAADPVALWRLLWTRERASLLLGVAGGAAGGVCPPI